MELKKIIELVNQFRYSFDKDELDKCKQMLPQLKIALTQFSFLLPSISSSNVEKEAFLARELLELATLLAVKLEDIKMFERHVSQLKPYYFDAQKTSELSKIGVSERQYSILGLNLLRLLTQNRMAEFHAELELIPHDMLSNAFISHPVELERLLMEGSYNKAMAMREIAPSEYFRFFSDILIDTVRNEVADCFEKAYESLPVSYAQQMLFIDDPMEMTEFCNDRKWRIENDRVLWNEAVTDAEVATVIPTTKLIKQTIAYAREVEMII